MLAFPLAGRPNMSTGEPGGMMDTDSCRPDHGQHTMSLRTDETPESPKSTMGGCNAMLPLPWAWDNTVQATCFRHHFYKGDCFPDTLDGTVFRVRRKGHRRYVVSSCIGPWCFAGTTPGSVARIWPLAGGPAEGCCLSREGGPSRWPSTRSW